MALKGLLRTILTLIRIRRKVKRLLKFFLFTLLLFVGLLVINESWNNSVIKNFNYFLEIESRRNVGLLVDLPNCKILNVSAWDSSILSLIEAEALPLKPYNCDQEKRIWSYVNQRDLVFNKSAIIESGFSFESLSCCYYTFERVEESQNNYTPDSDKLIRFSYICIKIEETTTPIWDEYIRVICRNKMLFGLFSRVVYKKYHIFAISERSPKTREKIEYWKKPQNILKWKPPNVVLIGIDSVSRLSSIRNMPKTRNILKKIGAIEYFGYTKAGENTPPNTNAFLSGYSVSDANEICDFNNTQHPFDYCPYIWRDFDQAKYFTSEIEEEPMLGTFNYLSQGFVQQPADFYYRTFSLAYYHYEDFVKTNPSNNIYGGKGSFGDPPYCIGYETYEQNSLNYIQDLIKMSDKVDVPIFVRSWQTTLAHNNLNGAQLGDETFADFFDKFNLNNTVLIFLSDHGYRYGTFRNTFVGWLEDKLPTFFIVLSDDLKVKYPHWQTNLKENSRKLTSPYDLYQTMSDILKITSNITISNSRLPNGEILPRKFGQSLISSKIEDSRNCAEAGIPDQYCACIIPQQINLDNPKLKLIAKKSLEYIYSFLPHEFCSKLYLKTIYSGALLENNNEQVNYIVSFLAGPGHFQFEVNVPYFWANDSFSFISTSIQRINKINSNVDCVSDRIHELYCYCR